MRIIRIPLLIFLFLQFYYIVPAKGSDNYHTKGLEFFNAGDYENAKKKFLKSVEKFPENSIYVYDLGVTCFYLGDFFDSLENFDMAISLNPEFGRAFFARGVVRLKMGNIDKAREEFKEGCDRGYKDGCTVYSNL